MTRRWQERETMVTANRSSIFLNLLKLSMVTSGLSTSL